MANTLIDEATGRSIANIIIALGGPLLIISFGRTVYKWWTGREKRKQVRNMTATERVEKADALRISALEYAAGLRRQLKDAKIEPEPWPEELGRAPRQTKIKETEQTK